MNQNGTEFKWTKARILAAQLVAADELTDEEIAEKLEISRSTLNRWKIRTEFRERVSGITAETAEALKSKGIRIKSNRLDNLNASVEKIKALMAARAADMADVPGGATGLLTRRKKIIGAGEAAREIEEYQADTALLKEYRELMKQAAIELGEWTEKQSIEGNISGSIEAAIIRIPVKAASREEWEQSQKAIHAGPPAEK